jgi:hypothetical protein
MSRYLCLIFFHSRFVEFRGVFALCRGVFAAVLNGIRYRMGCDKVSD